MMLSCIFLILIITGSYSWSTNTTTNTSSILQLSQYTALEDFYFSLGGPYWVWNNSLPGIPWNFSKNGINPCTADWQGLVCRCPTSNCTVVKIYLPGHNLTGTIPESLANFTSLTNLHLARNKVSGGLPNSLYFLPLVDLDLSINNLTGTLSEKIRFLTKLQYLELRRNTFFGGIPNGLYHLSQLKFIDLQANFFNGSISSSISSLTSLDFLSLSVTFLHGPLPETIGQLRNLTQLHLRANRLSGSIPSSVGQMSGLRTLDLSFNHFTGPIPESIGNLQRISFLSLSGNKLTRLPDSIGNLTLLKYCYIDANQISGTFPQTFSSLTRVRVFFAGLNNFYGNLSNSIINSDNNSMLFFNAAGNLLSGPLPDQLIGWKDLRYLEFNLNSFTGQIPSSFRSFSYLLGIVLYNNFFTGDNLGEIFNQTDDNLRLIAFQVSDNLFSGSLPLGPWKVLKFYLTAMNYFIGTIPNSFNETTYLYYLDVSRNFLTGPAPDYFPQLTYLTYLNMSVNLLTGPFLYSISSSNQNQLQQLAVSYNFLTGPLSHEVAYVTNLSYIIMNNNRFTGTLPKSWGLFKQLQICFLQNNLISGPLYPYLLPSLLNLDVSHNLFTGSFPSIQSGTVNIETFAGSSNCFSGSVPEDICNATRLTFLALDGLATASACRHYIFPYSNLLNSFYISNYFVSGIPTCLFSMPHLETLHLSGNGLTGSLPTNLNISESLVDLSLSHNQLTGTIPLVIQERYWQNLDLSYNKLTGTLSDHFHSYEESSSLSLQINRLSGSIPSSLFKAEQIDILEGNMFACNVYRDDLPSHDPKFIVYSCDSDIVNATLYSWIGIVFMILTLFLALHWDLSHRFGQYWRGSSNRKDSSDVLREGAEKVSIVAMREMNSSITTSTVSADSSPLESFSLRVYVQHLTIFRHNFAVLASLPLPSSYLCSFAFYLKSLREVVQVITGALLLMMMPLYIGVSFFYSSYDYQYAWIVSAVLLTGETAAIILSIGFFVLSIFIIGLMVRFQYLNRWFTRLIKKYRRGSISTTNMSQAASVIYRSSIARFADSSFFSPNKTSLPVQISSKPAESTEATMSEHRTKSREDVLSNTKEEDRERAESKENRSSLSQKIFRQRVMNGLVYLLLALLNCTIMVISDVFYVYILLTYSTGVIIASEVLLAVFKLLLNNVGIWIAIPLLRERFQRCFFADDTDSASERDSIESVMTNEMQYQYFTHYNYSAADISFITAMILLNNMTFPIIAILIVSPECFYNALFAASAITSDYSYSICDRVTIIAGTCQRQILLSESTSYDPPFIPDYECASALVINYVPVFVIMLTVEGIVSPLSKLLLQYFYFFLKSRGISNSEETTASVFDHRLHRKELEKSSLLSLVCYLLPDNLKELLPHPPQQDQVKSHFVLFNKNRLAVRLNANLVILCSFGALFPPLALIVCITIFTVTIYEEIVIGRLLYESERLGYVWYKRQLERDCYGISDSLKYTLWSLVPVSSFFFAYLVFDMWGDEKKWQSSLPLSLLMLFLPFAVLLTVSWHQRRKTRGTSLSFAVTTKRKTSVPEDLSIATVENPLNM